ncbi:MAG: outer membrane beta-barrel protein [Mucilaginibacter sp.]
MKIKIPAILAFCLFSLSLFAQNTYSIKGAAVDTDLRAKLVNTSITILNAKDSVLVDFTLAAEHGAFTVNNLPAGKFILLVTYPDYADYVETFTLDGANPSHDFGNINMRTKSKILQEVMIKGEVRAIKIKGDTTEFNAKAFVTQPNAKVEDLLKQLPGIQVDKDGKITANGEAVNKVLVDGEEFFGDDPTLVTKNIRADMVDKVQLYDKKSDQATFTGVDDGVKTKTINIKLKEDKKNGAFGKLSAGVGNDGYYEGQGLYNKFKGKEKFSVYGTLANDGKIGLGFEDNSKLGTSGSNVQVGDDGGISIFFSGGGDDLDSFDGSYNGKGLPIARSGGVHFDNKWNSDKESINANYKIGSIQVDGLTTSQSQQSLPNGLLNTNSNETFKNYAFRQKADVTYQVNLDTSTTLKIMTDATVKTFNVNNTYQTYSNRNDTLLNRNNRSVTNSGTNKIFDISALYTKKFKKPRRTFSWNISEAYNNNQTHGYLVSEVDFYNGTGALDSVQKINQYKTINSTSSVLNSNMTYTEPLSKALSIVFNYGLALNNSTADKQSFNQSAPGVYNVLDYTYSNNYQFNQLTHQLGAIFNYKKGKMTLNFGTKASDVNFKQINELTGDVYERDFINLAPQANLQFKISQQKSFRLNYSGSNTQPTIEQIQPVKENSNPLNIILGNPDLKSFFTNRLNANYNSYQVISGQSIFVGANYSFTSNTIVNNTTTDYTTGKTSTQYLNLGNKTPYNYSIYANSGFKIKPIDLRVGINASMYSNVSYSYINGALNTAKTESYSGGLQISKYEEKKYDFYVNGGPSYTINQFSLQTQSNNNAPGFNLYGGGEVYLPGKFQVETNVRYFYEGKTQALNANSRTIANASLNKTFFKEDNLKFSLSVNNLFNQDVNFNRNIAANAITQTTSTGIRRYFMLSVSWDFTSFATLPAKN